MKRTVTFEYIADEFETREDLDAMTLNTIACHGECVYDEIEPDAVDVSPANSDDDLEDTTP